MPVLFSVIVNMKIFTVLTVIKLNHRAGRKGRHTRNSSLKYFLKQVSSSELGLFRLILHVSFPYFTLSFLVAIIRVVWSDRVVNVGPYRRYKVLSSELKLLIKLPASRAECKTLRFQRFNT
jgi:hypothetical protein